MAASKFGFVIAAERVLHKNVHESGGVGVGAVVLPAISVRRGEISGEHTRDWGTGASWRRQLPSAVRHVFGNRVETHRIL